MASLGPLVYLATDCPQAAATCSGNLAGSRKDSLTILGGATFCRPLSAVEARAAQATSPQ